MKNDKRNIHLGGTARSPEDVERLYHFGLQFAEIPITKPTTFSELVEVYQDLKHRFGLYYLCHGPQEGDPNDMKNLEREYLPKVLYIIHLMAELEMPLLTVHLWLDPRFVKEEVISFKMNILERIIDRAENQGITVCMENLSERASDMAVPFRELPLLFLTLDIGHGQLITGRNTSYEFIEQYPERIKHIHLHDNRGGDSYLDDLHLPPGKGVIEFEKIFDGLKRFGYDRTITLELKLPEIKRSLGYVKKLISQ